MIRTSIQASANGVTRRPVLVAAPQGDTGGYAIGALATFGAGIRAVVRKDDDRTARLRAAGADVILPN